MDLTLTSSVLVLVPCGMAVLAGVVYLYGLVANLLSKTSVHNKVVVITDALSSLGKECARVFHKGGARLILCGKSWEKLEDLADELAHSSDPTDTFLPKLVLLDFGDMGSMAEVVMEVMECYGCLDVLILNSSLKVKAPAHCVSLETDKLLMDNNYFGPVTLAKGQHTTGVQSHRTLEPYQLKAMSLVEISGDAGLKGLKLRSVLPSMISRRTGHLLLVNSIQGKLAVPFRTAYAASKHAVQAFFDSLRPEVEEYGISVSTLSHTYICSTAAQQPISSKTFWSFMSSQRTQGVTPHQAVEEIIRTVMDKRKEVVIAPPLPKAAICTRSFFPNLFFAVMAAGVKNTKAVEMQ